MIIEYGNSIKQILQKNLGVIENEPIIGVGVNVMVKTFNNDKPFFYKNCTRNLYKRDLDTFVSKEDFENDNVLNRYIVAVRANVNMMIDQFKDDADSGNLVQVFEGDGYIKKLINVDTIQEVQGVVFDSQEKLKGKK